MLQFGFRSVVDQFTSGVPVQIDSSHFGWRLGYGSRSFDLGFGYQVNFIRSMVKSRSISGHAFTFGERVMSWHSKKQNCITVLAMEAGCVSCYHRDKKHCHEVYIDEQGDYVPLTKPFPSDAFKTHLLSLGIHKV